MSEDELNIKYIQKITGLVDNDELLPIILGMTKEAYKSGLTQAEIDNTMGVIEENSDLKSRINKAIKYIQNNKLYDFIYDDEELFEKVSDKTTKDYLLYILRGDKE